MGIAIPQIITGDSAAGAAQLGYSVKFNARGNYSQQQNVDWNTNDGCDLAFTPSSNGNRRTWTYSTWVKRSKIIYSHQSNQDTFMALFGHTASGAASYQCLLFHLNSDQLSVWVSGTGGGGSVTAQSNAQYRDINGWYNIVWVSDTTNATAADRWKFYINGADLADTPTGGGGFATNNIASISQNHDGFINSSSYEMTIGSQKDYNTDQGRYFDGYMSQCVMVDGQALDASYFGFEDPMTGVWRPKKFNIEDCPTADFGTNGFYLPMDGSGPIGKDQSGKGNDWTPRNFEGTAPMDMAEGGLPMLETSTGTNVQYKGYAATKWSENTVFTGDCRGMPVDTRGYIGYAVTVANPTGSQNRYYIGISTDNDSSIGGEEAPLLRLARGQTVNFFQSDGTNSGHPLKIGTTAEAASAASGYDMSGFAHTVGSPAQRQSRFTITIPNDAPDTLYYSCSAHTGMGGTISVYTDPVVADPYAAKCRVAMPLSASRQDRACGIAVTAEYKTVSDNGGINAGLRSCHGGLYGQAGQSWVSLGQYLSRPSSYDYDMGTAPFTVEIWCWPSNCKTAGQYKRAWEFGSSNSDNICLSAETINNGISWSVRKDDALKLSSATQTGTGSTCSVVNKKWTHVAVVREGTGSNETKLYVDGIQASSCTLSDDLDFSDDTLRIGANNADASNSSWNGYLNDFRFYKGVAKYTKNFAVPSFTGGTFVKDSPYALPAGGPASSSPKYGHGSIVYGKAENGYNSIQIPGFGLTASEDYTVEFYYWWPGIDRGVILTQDDGSSVKINVATHRAGYFYNSTWNGSSGPGSPVAGSMLANSWNHICFQYWNQHQTMTLTINGGEQKYSNVGATWEGPGSGDGLGLGNSGIEQSTTTANSAISNFRVVKGRRVYENDTGVAGFQPPSGPLENITGTYLLCAKDPTDPLAYEVAPAATLATIAATPVNARSAAPPGGSGSCEFDGTGDSLLPAVSNKFTFGYGDFTIEAWVKSDNNSDSPYIVDFRDDGSDTGTTNKPVFYVNSSNKLIYWLNGSSRIESDSTINTGSWYHVAIVRCGLNHTMYVNGVAQTQKYVYHLQYSGTNMTVTIGQRQGYSAQSWDGHISNFRITRAAVYKEGFTATCPLESIPGTVLLCCKSSSSATAQDTPWPLYKSGHVYSSEHNPFDDEYQNRTGSESGYATLNPLPACTDGRVYISNGGLTYYSPTSGGNNAVSLSSLSIPSGSGKWYCEYRHTWGSYPEPGLAHVEVMEGLESFDEYLGGGDGGEWMWYSGTSYMSGATNTYGRGSTPGAANPGILGIGFDSDVGQLNFYWNGADQGAMTIGIRTDNGHYAFGCGANSQMATFNFGQTPFQSPVPYGYKALCSSNLYNVGISTVSNTDINPENHIGIVTYTGDGATNRTIHGLKFQPDLMWIAPRDENNWKVMFDSVRGDGKSVYSNSTWIQESLSNTGGVPLIDGFTVGYNSAYSSVFTNKNTIDYVAWCWKAGGNKDTFNIDDVGYATFAASGTPSGGTTPTGTSINTKVGFSIIRFTPTSAGGSATVPHGLGRVPGLILMKSLTNSYNWDVYQTFATPGGSDRLVLNGTGGVDTSDPFTNVPVTKDVFTFNNAFYGDASDDVICYIWADTPGIFKTGEYKGTGNATDAPFIYTGFKPALVIIKRTDTANDWNMQDIVRSPFNGMDGEVLQANSESSESNIGTGYERDHLSNGFKLRSDGTETNGSGGTYIYMAWSAEGLSNQYGGISNAQ